MKFLTTNTFISKYKKPSKVQIDFPAIGINLLQSPSMKMQGWGGVGVLGGGTGNY